MKDQRRKVLSIAAVAYAAFTAVSVIGPILLERMWKKKEGKK